MVVVTGITLSSEACYAALLGVADLRLERVVKISRPIDSRRNPARQF